MDVAGRRSEKRGKIEKNRKWKWGHSLMDVCSSGKFVAFTDLPFAVATTVQESEPASAYMVIVTLIYLAMPKFLGLLTAVQYMHAI